MSVIVEFRVLSSDFELGQILSVEGDSTIELETLVPLGEASVPLFWIRNSTRESFVESVQRHPSVEEATRVDAFEERTLFTLDWDANQDHLVSAVQSNDGQMLSAVGSAASWTFEVRFPTHESLSAFSTDCEEAGIEMTVTRVYNPSEPDVQPWLGLTEPQLEALTLAIEMGYYDIPRGCTTKELADELGISDQAVTERLRRAITALVTYTLPIDSESR
ncbi:helix-turn-helix domain-containing protein [Halorubrum sp. Ib24]|uniref:helix-turn-helix domain-containing protein n=1 Tax=unclassified Halorubrum TaxID=2642239 RepID=UPI000B99AF58|nr:MULTISPECIES: helix-turn-helix domain-containing protein [unclassified Halorubrum]OYR41712.1 helix-turn-helix domain-containing protein [Halorubrum sp. Ib24]OYR47792.1 helix-turn-helix domain-containing protein [Halorubrum sp. Hd13]OYR48670.1 helix-turn-helix domain-containing protein [Halorubrum sp. Ea8]OYR54496.1 helix-turn-helix domain-containing protein [Halorubrum sp. Ea1]